MGGPGSGAAWAASPTCADAREGEALRVRSLQNKLMVAALMCDEQARYDAFIRQYGTALTAHGRVMTDYFTKRHGAKRVKRVMDDYVTAQANVHSLDSMTSRVEFCQKASATLDALLSGDASQLVAASAEIANDRVEGPLACLRESRD
jgi:hypothetical protein